MAILHFSVTGTYGTFVADITVDISGNITGGTWSYSGTFVDGSVVPQGFSYSGTFSFKNFSSNTTYLNISGSGVDTGSSSAWVYYNTSQGKYYLTEDIYYNLQVTSNSTGQTYTTSFRGYDYGT